MYCIVDLSNCGVKLIFADVVLNATDDNIKLMKFFNLTYFHKPNQLPLSLIIFIDHKRIKYSFVFHHFVVWNTIVLVFLQDGF